MTIDIFELRIIYPVLPGDKRDPRAVVCQEIYQALNRPLGLKIARRQFKEDCLYLAIEDSNLADVKAAFFQALGKRQRGTLSLLTEDQISERAPEDIRAAWTRAKRPIDLQNGAGIPAPARSWLTRLLGL